MTVLYGRFDSVTGARIQTVLSRRVSELWRAEDPKSRLSTEQRMADALTALLTGQNGDGSQGTTLLVMVDYDIAAQELRNGRLGDGTPIPVEKVMDMACEESIVPAVFNGEKRPLWVGRAKRLATPAQRLALVARDGGCVTCGASSDWCQAHHVILWSAGGPTDLDNLCLLCSRCHHQVHDDGWRIEQTPDGGFALRAPPVQSPPPSPVWKRRGGRRPTIPLIL